MKKKKTIILASIITLLAVAITLIAFNYKHIYYRLFPTDRITGTYSFTIEGNEPEFVLDEYYEFEDSGKVRLESEGFCFKIAGGEYGRYKIGFMANGDDLYSATADKSFQKKDYDFSISYMNANWWNVTEIELDINLIKEDKWYAVYQIDYTNILEDGTKSSDSINKKIALDEKQEVMFGL